jgi:uncharacterized protein (UPF0332 family)
VPPDPDELLQQADALAGKPAATQADVRRAISAAYYAIFHFCMTAAADMVLGTTGRSTSSYSFVSRSVDHKTLRGLCAQLSQTKPQNVAITPCNGFGAIADFARVTVSLQGQRHLADYDASRNFTDAEAKVAISEARQAIAWFKSCDDEQQRAFRTMLLFRQR